MLSKVSLGNLALTLWFVALRTLVVQAVPRLAAQGLVLIIAAL